MSIKNGMHMLERDDSLTLTRRRFVNADKVRAQSENSRHFRRSRAALIRNKDFYLDVCLK